MCDVGGDLACDMSATQGEDDAQQESNEMVDSQRALSEGVGSMQSQVERVKVTCATRISDLDSEHFQNDMSAAAATQKRLVYAAAEAAERLAQGGVAADDVGAVVDEAIVALMNDLMMSESVEAFFGVSVPGEESFDAAVLLGPLPDGLLGLLCYRAWQLLTRTKAGRAILLECGEAPEGSSVDSYAALHGVLVDAIMRGEQISLFEHCISEMPTGNGRATGHNAPTLSRYEKTQILAAIRNGSLDWNMLKV